MFCDHDKNQAGMIRATGELDAFIVDPNDCLIYSRIENETTEKIC